MSELLAPVITEPLAPPGKHGIVLPTLARAILRLGLKELRSLGFRPTELTHMLSQSTATVKRYSWIGNDTTPDSDSAPPLQALRQEPRRAITRFWVTHIAGGRPIAPRWPEFLTAFCPVCVTGGPVCTAPRPRRPRRPLTGLHQALYLGLRCCEAGIIPCVSSPARLAALFHYTRTRPWETCLFLATEVHPDRWWLRHCSVCHVDIITRSPKVNRCLQHQDLDLILT